MTWVVSDYTATPGTTEVSVLKGQQVEIIDTACNGAPEFCLVRLNTHSGEGGATTEGSGGTQEGLVPVSVLKPAPTGKSSHRRNVDASNNDAKEQQENNGE